MRMLTILALLVFFAATQKAQGQDSEISDTRLQDITSAITQICHHPSRRGEYWDVKVTGEGKAIIKLIGLGVEATFSKGEWDGVKEVLTPEGQVADRARARECAEKLTPLFLEKFFGN